MLGRRIFLKPLLPPKSNRYTLRNKTNKPCQRSDTQLALLNQSTLKKLSTVEQDKQPH